MDVRPILMIIGLILVFGYAYFGTWAIWLGAPLFFMGVILKFIDQG